MSVNETILETKLSVIIKKQTNIERLEFFLVAHFSNNKRVFSYSGIAQHTILTRPLLPGNPKWPLPIDEKPPGCGNAPA